MRHIAPLVMIVLLASCGAGARGGRAGPPRQGEVDLDETGGDVWAFERRVGGRAPEGCVMVEIKRGAVHLRVPVRRGRFDTVVPLAPGENALSVYCADPPEDANDAQAVYRVRLPATPRAAVGVTVLEGAIVVDAGGTTPNPATLARIERVRWVADADNPAPLVTRDGRPLGTVSDEHVELARPSADGRYRVWLHVVDEAGREDRAGAAFVVEDGRARRVDALREPPAWALEGVVYGVVPFLFGDPALEAVTADLARLASLGVTTLWLSPIFEAPDEDYGYAVTDYFQVRPAFGSLEDFRALVDAAHALGMRVMLDFVPSHTSAEHPYFLDAERSGRRSPYYGFYERGDDGRPTHYFDWEHLPNLDYRNPEVRRFITEAFSFWVRELDVDGFRVDVAWAIERRAPGFFDALRRELVRIEPDVALVAEASAREAAYFTSGFDAAYDWSEQVGQWAWAEVFADGRADVAALHRALTASPAPGRVFRFLDNNDTGARFVTRHGAAMERVAAALLFTVPGVPVLFTGQERGAEYEPYQRERPLELDADPAREGYYAALAALRRAEPALTAGRFVPLEAEPADRVYAFARVPERAGRPIVTALNFGARPVTARVRLPPELEGALERGHTERLLGRAAPRARAGALSSTLAPHEAAVWGLGSAENAPSLTGPRADVLSIDASP